MRFDVAYSVMCVPLSEEEAARRKARWSGDHFSWQFIACGSALGENLREVEIWVVELAVRASKCGGWRWRMAIREVLAY